MLTIEAYHLHTYSCVRHSYITFKGYLKLIQLVNEMFLGFGSSIDYRR